MHNIFILSLGKEAEVYDAFKQRSEGMNFSVYTKENMPSAWHYTNNRRIMPIILVSDLGFAFDDFYDTIHSYNKKYGLTRKFDTLSTD